MREPFDASSIASCERLGVARLDQARQRGAAIRARALLDDPEQRLVDVLARHLLELVERAGQLRAVRQRRFDQQLARLRAAEVRERLAADVADWRSPVLRMSPSIAIALSPPTSPSALTAIHRVFALPCSAASLEDRQRGLAGVRERGERAR